ncbi:MAG: hypothetical protein LBU23_05445 [Planctomycetota bacterium]|jgi:hypothetical protein|nr:hypothetical protein [Planctomycetota bacterium]
MDAKLKQALDAMWAEIIAGERGKFGAGLIIGRLEARKDGIYALAEKHLAGLTREE